MYTSSSTTHSCSHSITYSFSSCNSISFAYPALTCASELIIDSDILAFKTAYRFWSLLLRVCGCFFFFSFQCVCLLLWFYCMCWTLATAHLFSEIKKRKISKTSRIYLSGKKFVASIASALLSKIDTKRFSALMHSLNHRQVCMLPSPQ